MRRQYCVLWQDAGATRILSIWKHVFIFSDWKEKMVLKRKNLSWTRLTCSVALGRSRGTPALGCPGVFILSYSAERMKGSCFCIGMQLTVVWARFAVKQTLEMLVVGNGGASSGSALSLCALWDTVVTMLIDASGAKGTVKQRTKNQTLLFQLR